MVATKSRGQAAVLAMWLLAILLIIGVTFAFMMRTETRISKYYRDDMQAMFVAQAGLEHAVYLIKKDYELNPNFDTLKEEWSAGLIHDTADNDGDGTTNELKEGFNDMPLWDEDGNIVGTYTIRIYDEAGKVNINNYYADTAEVGPRADDGGWKASPWHNLLESLRDVKESGETVTAGDPDIDVTTATNIISYRLGPDGIGGTSDDNPFQFREEILNVTGMGGKTYYGEDCDRDDAFDNTSGESFGNDIDNDGHIDSYNHEKNDSQDPEEKTLFGGTIKDDGDDFFDRGVWIALTAFPVEADHDTNPTTERLSINVNTANRMALQAALGMVSTLDYAIEGVTNLNIDRVVNSIIDYREGADGIEGTADDNPFDGVDSNVVDQQGNPTSFKVTTGTYEEKDFEAISTDLNPTGGTFTSAREEFNTLINYIYAFGYPSGSAKITKAYVRDNIKDNFDPGSTDYDNWDSNNPTTPDVNDDDNTKEITGTGDNTRTTDFCFKSYNYFEIIVTGKVGIIEDSDLEDDDDDDEIDEAGEMSQVLAEKKIRAIFYRRTTSTVESKIKFWEEIKPE